MTVPSSSNRMEYTGNGVASSFDYTFQIFADSDLQVYVLDTDGVQTELVLNTDFTVSGAGDPDGGSITLTAGPLTVGYELVILREVPLTQEVDLRNQGAYYPETVETMGDRLMMAIQQIAERLGRSLIKAVTGGTIDAGGARITNVGAPSAPTDAATFGAVAAAEAAAAESAAAAFASEYAAAHSKNAAIEARDDAIDAKDAAEAAAAGVNLPSIGGGDVGRILRVNTDADGYVLDEYLAAGSVDTNALAEDAVTSDKIAASAVTEDKLAAGAVTEGKIATNAVTASKVAAGAITLPKIDVTARAAGVVHPNVAGSVTTRAGTYTSVDTGGLSGHLAVVILPGIVLRPGGRYYLVFNEVDGGTIPDGWCEMISYPIGLFPPVLYTVVNTLPYGTYSNPLSGTVTLYEWDMTTTGARMSDAVECVSCNTNGREFAVNSPAGAFEFVSGSAKTGSALLGIQPGSVALGIGGNADSRIHQFVNASGTATAPTVVSLTAVPD